VVPQRRPEPVLPIRQGSGVLDLEVVLGGRLDTLPFAVEDATTGARSDSIPRSSTRKAATAPQAAPPTRSGPLTSAPTTTAKATRSPTRIRPRPRRLWQQPWPGAAIHTWLPNDGQNQYFRSTPPHLRSPLWSAPAPAREHTQTLPIRPRKRNSQYLWIKIF
jgi:hypothetical protein